MKRLIPFIIIIFAIISLSLISSCMPPLHGEIVLINNTPVSVILWLGNEGEDYLDINTEPYKYDPEKARNVISISGGSEGTHTYSNEQTIDWDLEIDETHYITSNKDIHKNKTFELGKSYKLTVSTLDDNSYHLNIEEDDYEKEE
ncbi:MAG: hypothetical protein ACOCV8_06085 [Spirochaetota bacterium]